MQTIEVTTDIDAPRSAVWETLTDFETYPEWNPFVTSATGQFREGERVRVRIDPPAGRAMTFRPTVTVWEPEADLEWLGRLVVPGLFDGRHTFRLEELDGDRTRLVQRESFSGLLVGLLLNEEDIRAGFTAMNEAVRERAEARTAVVA